MPEGQLPYLGGGIRGMEIDLGPEKVGIQHCDTPLGRVHREITYISRWLWLYDAALLGLTRWWLTPLRWRRHLIHSELKLNCDCPRSEGGGV
jgi:hypothetical protein